ncbi:MAG: hypothetical protein AAB553_03255 [Patescibacteria group bacterium]
METKLFAAVGNVAPDRTTKEQVAGAFDRLGTRPDILIGNGGELGYMTGASTDEDALDEMYDRLQPDDRRFAAMTLGQDSVWR